MADNNVVTNDSEAVSQLATLAKPNIQVKFTRSGREVDENLAPYDWKAGGGGGSLGIWHYTKGAQEAWKVFGTRTPLSNLRKYYNKASTAQLPMGNMTPLLLEATVKNLDNGTTSDGFVLITEWISGAFFQQSKTGQHLTNAMKTGEVPAGKTSVDYQKITRGVEAAKEMAYLYDCQGFIRGGGGFTQPVVFVDINWHATSSTGVDGMLDDLANWK